MLNRVVLVGRLTKEPDFKMTPSGVAVCKFTLAVNRTFSNGQGEKETDYVPIIVWRRQAENVNQYCSKGSLVGVDGRIQTGSYEGQDGKRVYTTDVVAESVQFLDTKKQEEPQYKSPQNNFNSHKKDVSEIDWSDPDSLPF